MGPDPGLAGKQDCARAAPVSVSELRKGHTIRLLVHSAPPPMLLPSRCISSTRCSLHGPQQRARAARPLQRLRPCADAAPAQQPEAQPAPAQLQGPAVLQTLCARALARAGFKERHLIGIAGAPGSGVWLH